MKLNCDLGESFGNWSMGCDAQVMPFIDQANIACGFHAGDPLTAIATLKLAVDNGVGVGAHPSYPDIQGFGRRSMNCSREEIIALVQYQIAALDGLASSYGATVEYVKPHGALYNDMMSKASVRTAIMDGLVGYQRPLKLMLQATPDSDDHAQEAKDKGLELLFEGFADRRYTDEGRLQPRSESGSVLNGEQTVAQVAQLILSGTVTTVSGNQLPLKLDSLCVHGDNDASVAMIQQIRALING